MRLTSSSGHGHGELTTLPGCPHICVFHNAFIHTAHQNAGHGTRAHHERLLAARALGYSAALCTVNKENDAQHRILRRFKWEPIQALWNPATGNFITVYWRILDIIPALPESKPSA